MMRNRLLAAEEGQVRVSSEVVMGSLWKENVDDEL